MAAFNGWRATGRITLSQTVSYREESRPPGYQRLLIVNGHEQMEMDVTLAERYGSEGVLHLEPTDRTGSIISQFTSIEELLPDNPKQDVTIRTTRRATLSMSVGPPSLSGWVFLDTKAKTYLIDFEVSSPADEAEGKVETEFVALFPDGRIHRETQTEIFVTNLGVKLEAQPVSDEKHLHGSSNGAGEATFPIDGFHEHGGVPTMTWDLTLEEGHYDASGLLGDVVTIDLRALGVTGVDGFTLNDEMTSTNPSIPASHRDHANDSGYIAMSEDTDQRLHDDGICYYVPVATGQSELRFWGHVEGAEDDYERASVVVRLQIEDGYSTEGRDIVSFGTQRLDSYRQQQRLHYFGFPDPQGNSLEVDGARGPSLDWATGLFCHALDHRLAATPFALAQFTEQGRTFINARNAPRWEELLPGPGYVILPMEGGAPQTERWGTSWAREVIQTAGASYLIAVAALRAAGQVLAAGDHSLRVSALSLRMGGVTPFHSDHRAGMHIDIETQSGNAWTTPFYRSHQLGGRRYIAAGTVDDPRGDQHVICVTSQGEYVATAFTGNALPRGAVGVEHNAANYENQRLLERIANLLVDNPAVQYSLPAVRAMLTALADITATVSGARVERMLYNDPRTWDIRDVGYCQGHGGHIHVKVQVPEPRTE